MAPRTINLVCFRVNPAERTYTEAELEQINRNIMDEINRTGKMFFTHTKLKGRFSLRLCIGQTSTTREHVRRAWEMLKAAAVNL
ncbi:MAG TPA: hypothetical protein EYP19_13795 [Desulfobacterales bacterium]|nr:hypothetical protein [Desulfobacterales bacterium]